MFYTTRQASDILGYKSLRSVKSAIHQGVIKADKIGRDWMITGREINRLLRNRTKSSTHGHKENT